MNALDMNALDGALATALARGEVPFAVAMTANAGGITWSGTAGEAGAGSIFRIYSMTKAIGSLAAMILIDRGRLSLDTPVAEILPEWDDLPLLAGWDGDTPILRKPAQTATVRHLATHMSGLEYDMWSADTKRYLKQQKVPIAGTGRLEALARHPLTFEPGSRWGYGISTDWLGRVVETVDGRRIDAFCQAEIFEPLGMTDTVFEIAGREARVAPAFQRNADGGFDRIELGPPSGPEFYGMGHALWSTAPDYMRVLRMVLNRGELDGIRVLSEAAVDSFCADQMQGKRFEKMVTVAPWRSADVDLFPGLPTTHSVAFQRIEADVPGKRSAGSLGWAGICNTHYWVDPARGLAAVFMTQLLPFVEPGALAAYDRFERAVYATL